jgi:hypothetical protein
LSLSYQLFNTLLPCQILVYLLFKWTQNLYVKKKQILPFIEDYTNTNTQIML